MIHIFHVLISRFDKLNILLFFYFYFILKTKYMDRVTQIIALIKKELYTQSSQNNKQDTASTNCQWDPQAFLGIIEEPR
jgi:hypothetical protein